MWLKLFIGLIIFMAILAGALTLILPREYIVNLIMFRDAFDVALPMLAFGALIKYLCTCKESNK